MMNFQSVADLKKKLEQENYIVDEELATILYIFFSLQRPLLIEGPPGVGKTEVALVLSKLLNTKLIRLQCYEGMDINTSTYEWNYQKQLLRIKLLENEHISLKEKEDNIFNKDYLLSRPLLQSILEENSSPILLIDELDRSDEDFEAFLLELLSAFQITVPEIGTIKAKHIPYVILTSNRTRELSDALKRRCLYHWIDFPELEKELAIVHKKLPHIEMKLLSQVVNVVHQIREKKLSRIPGVSETIDWVEALHRLGRKNMDEQSLVDTIGCIIKSVDDRNTVLSEELKLNP